MKSMKVEKWGSLEPSFHHAEQRKLALRAPHQVLVFRGEMRGVGFLIIEEPLFRFHSDSIFQEPELVALKTRRRRKEITEIEKVQWSHGFEHAELINQ